MTIFIRKSATANFETIEINDTPLGKGGQGAVHNIITSKYSADYCIKIYIRDAEKMHKKIEYMVAHPPQNICDTSFRICWPVALAYNSRKEFIGYMMPLAFPKGHNLTILSVYRSKPLSQLKRFKNKVEWHNKYELDSPDGIVNRVKMLCNIAIALHSIHSTGRYVLVDLKPENIDATGTGKVSIMDADSIQISENGRILHPATAYTPEYFAPEGKELQKQNRPFPLQCDYFAAAVCFYQILTGTHPYSGTVLKPPYDNCTEIADCIANGLFAFGEKQRYISLPTGFNLQQNFYNLPSTVQELFKRAFGSQASKRPTMEEWGRTFHEIITGGIKVGASAIKRDTSGIPLKITGVTFSDEDYEGNVIRSKGSKLYTNTTYLCPSLSYTVLNNVGNVDIHYKIIAPNGSLVTSSTTKGTLSLTSKGSYTKDIGGWGNKNRTAYSTPGEYHIEFYYKGKCIYKTTLTIYELGASVTTKPKVAPVTTTTVPRTTTTPIATTPFTPSTSSYKTSFWNRLNGLVEELGDWIDDNIDTMSDSAVWTIILGIPAAIGIIAGAIDTGSVFWGIVVAIIGFVIGAYAVTIGGFIISFIARILLNILRYILYNIYTLIITVVIILGIIFTPQIKNLFDGFSKDPVPAKVVNPAPVVESTTTYYCTAKKNLNIRKEPNSNAAVLGTLAPMQTVEVYSINGDWATVKYNNSKAYVSAKFIAPFQTTSTSNRSL